MGTFACNCGHILRGAELDESQGYLLYPKEANSLWNDFRREVASFLAAIKAGRRDAWLAEWGGNEYPKDLADVEVIDDIRSKWESRYGHSVIQCPKCSRIFVQAVICENNWKPYQSEDKEQS